MAAPLSIELCLGIGVGTVLVARLSEASGAAFAMLAGPWLLGGFHLQPPDPRPDRRVDAVDGVLLEPGQTFNLVVINALREAEDARYPAVVAAGSMVVVLGDGS